MNGVDSGTIVIERLPVRKVAREGEQEGAPEWKSVKRTPPAANLSRTGVFTGPP